MTQRKTDEYWVARLANKLDDIVLAYDEAPGSHLPTEIGLVRKLLAELTKEGRGKWLCCRGSEAGR